MRFLADVNMERAVVLWLRDEGHDVLWAEETHRQATGGELMELAERENRILITRDLDFGELVFRRRHASAGIIPLRIEGRHQAERLERLLGWWPEVQAHAPGHFITLTHRHMRLRELPPRTS